MVVSTRSFVLVAAFAGTALVPISAQLLRLPAAKSANISPGPAQRQPLLVTEPPAPGDRIGIRLTSQKITKEIVTPDGIRITAENAKETGFDWSDEIDLVPLGEDTAHTLRVAFTRPEPAGNYIVELTDKDPKRPVRANARFVARLADYAEQISSAHGLQIRAARIAGSADLPIEVASDFPKEANAWFEIAVTDPAAKLTLKLPSGRVLPIGPGEHPDYTLKTFTEAGVGEDTVVVTYGNLSTSVPVTVDGLLRVLPSRIVMYPGQKHKFTAQPAGLAKPVVAWSIEPALGNIDRTGLYAAPASIDTKQTVTVTATNTADHTQSASATITLSPAIAVYVIPSIVSLGPSETQIFGARVVNATWPDVIWNLPKGNPGTIDQYGHYTAPKSIDSTRTVTIQAISAMDGKTIGSAIVTLRPPVFRLTTKVSPNGSGTVTPGSSYAAGTIVGLDANPNAGYSFAGWSGSPNLVDRAANPTEITMKSGETVTAHFTALPTELKLSQAKKSGTNDSRLWRLELRNVGPGAANGAQLKSIELQQTQGAPCSPRIQGEFPMLLGNLAPGSSVPVRLTMNFSGCTKARFTMTALFSANDGKTSLSLSRQKQDP